MQFMTIESRIAAGTPEGGQFSTHTRADSGTGLAPETEGTPFTCFGHWDGDALIIEWTVEGEAEDDRPDFVEGRQSFCASATALTEEAAIAAVLNEYDPDDVDDLDDKESRTERIAALTQARDDAQRALNQELAQGISAAVLSRYPVATDVEFIVDPISGRSRAFCVGVDGSTLVTSVSRGAEDLFAEIQGLADQFGPPTDTTSSLVRVSNSIVTLNFSEEHSA
jgi:hypothetical protein